MRRSWFKYLSRICLAGVIVGISPALSVVISSMIANANECVLHEGYTNPCIIAGNDIGGLLGAMFIFGWFMLVSIPLGALSIIIWLVAFILKQFFDWRSRTV